MPSEVQVCAGPEVGRSMSVRFAPFSGLCYMQYSGDECLLSTPVLSALNEPCAGPLRAWVKVLQDGSIYFLRQKEDESLESSDGVEASGILPRNSFPKWACEYFVYAQFWRSSLPEPLDLRIIHSSHSLPSELDKYAPEKNVESTWSLHSWTPADMG